MTDGVPDVSVMASGNLGLITFPRIPGRATREQIEAERPGLIDALVAHPGIGFVMVDGEVLGKTEDPLAPYGPNAAAHVARTSAFPHCPDIMVNSTYWADLDEVAAFEELVGSHGGMGGGQAHPFVLAPARSGVAGGAGDRRGRRPPGLPHAGYSSTTPPGLTTVTSVAPVTAAANSSGGSVSSRS